MAHIKAVVGEAGRKLGLRTAQRPDIAYGVKDGYLVQVASGTADGGACAVEIVRYVDASRDAAVRTAVAESPAVSKGIIKSRDIQIGDGLAIHRRRRRLFRSVEAQRVGSDVEALLASVKRACPPPPASCRLCGNTSASEPMLLNDVVDRVCPSCIERLRHDVRRASQQYDDLPLNLPLAVMTAAVTAAVAALAWAGIAVATNRMFWAVAIGSGALIGYCTSRVVGRGGIAVQGVTGVFTVISVLLGQALFLAWQVHQHAQARGLKVDWKVFTAYIPSLLWADTGSTLFALGGGLLGAYYAVKRAAKPKLEVRVETTESARLPTSPSRP